MTTENPLPSHLDLPGLFVDTLARIIDLHDHDTWTHCQRVSELSVHLGLAFGLKDPDLSLLRTGAALHDLGKVGIPDYILLKPGPLTAQEREIMKKHPALGADLLSGVPFLAGALPIIKYHHEKWDGSGYPRGLAGEQIPFLARIVSLANVWDSLHTETSYRREWTHVERINHVCSLSGKHFDPKVVDVFIVHDGKNREPGTG